MLRRRVRARRQIAAAAYQLRKRHKRRRRNQDAEERRECRRGQNARRETALANRDVDEVRDRGIRAIRHRCRKPGQRVTKRDEADRPGRRALAARRAKRDQEKRGIERRRIRDVPPPADGDRSRGSEKDRADRGTALAEALFAQPEVREPERDVELQQDDAGEDPWQRQQRRQEAERRQKRHSEAGHARGDEWVPLKRLPVRFQDGERGVVRRRRIVDERVLHADLAHALPRLVVIEDVVGRRDAAHEERRKEEDEVINRERDEGDAMFFEEAHCSGEESILTYHPRDPTKRPDGVSLKRLRVSLKRLWVSS